MTAPDVPQLAALIELLPDAVALVGPDDRVLAANAAFQALLDEPIAPGSSVSAWLERALPHPQEAAGHWAADRAGTQVGPERIATLRHPVNSSVRVLRFRVAPLPGGLALIGVQDVSALRQLEVQANEQRRFFRALVDNALDVIAVFGRDGRIAYISPSVQRVAGLTPAELIGSDPFERIHPEDQERARELFARLLLAPGTQGQIEVRVRRADGRYLRAEVAASAQLDAPLIAGVLVTLRDISERHEAQLALRRSEELYRATTDALSEVLYVVDRELRLRLFNVVASRHNERFGLPLPCVGQRVREAFPFLLPTVEDELRQVLATGAPQHAEQLIPIGGQQVLAEVHRVPLRDGEQVSAVLTLVRDVTARRALEREALQTRKLDSIGILAAGIAHDFNNVVTAVLGNVALARAHARGQDKVGAALDKAELACLRARDLTANLVTYARGEPPQREPINLAALVAEAIALLVPDGPVRALAAVPPDLWLLRADRVQLGQVLHNLVLNAVEAMPAGGTLHLAATNERLGDEPGLPLAAGPYVRLEVRDEGQGIAPEHLEHVFDPYFTTKEHGVGLGLATTWAVIRRHDGHIAVRSTPGGGTTFSVWLPAEGPGAR